MSAAAVKIAPLVVPDHPPAPTVHLVSAQRSAKECELKALQAKIGEVAYQAVVGGKAGVDALAALHLKIQAAEFQVACNEAAHAHAIAVDKAAVADWWRQVQALPSEVAIEGISSDNCCQRCSEAGCVITGGPCGNPKKTGALSPQFQGNPVVRRLHVAASKKLGTFR